MDMSIIHINKNKCFLHSTLEFNFNGNFNYLFRSQWWRQIDLFIYLFSQNDHYVGNFNRGTNSRIQLHQNPYTYTYRCTDINHATISIVTIKLADLIYRKNVFWSEDGVLRTSFIFFPSFLLFFLFF